MGYVIGICWPREPSGPTSYQRAPPDSAAGDATAHTVLQSRCHHNSSQAVWPAPWLIQTSNMRLALTALQGNVEMYEWHRVLATVQERVNMLAEKLKGMLQPYVDGDRAGFRMKVGLLSTATLLPSAPCFSLMSWTFHFDCISLMHKLRSGTKPC